jgi:GTP-binding protein
MDVFGRQCAVVDTPGLLDDDDSPFREAVQARISDVIDEADLVVFVVDGTVGITEKDIGIASVIRKRGKKNVIVAINKSEKKSSRDSFIDALELGFGHNVSISAEHGLGIQDLLEIIHGFIDDDDDMPKTISSDSSLKLAIVGRPNVGKSTIVNKILNSDVLVVADMNGVTRESHKYSFEHNGQEIEIVDTPGIRRKSKITDVLEMISVANARKAYRNADTVILVIDSRCLIDDEIEHQDITLARSIIDGGKPLIIAFNKVDLTPYNKNETPAFVRRIVRDSIPQLKEVPFLFISGTNGDNLSKMIGMAVATYRKQFTEIKTSSLNNWLAGINKSDIIQRGTTKFKLKYITQVGKTPPKFLIFSTNTKDIRDSHRRYIENSLKNSFLLNSVPVQVFFRENKNKNP